MEPNQDGQENAYVNSLNDYRHKEKGIRSGCGIVNSCEGELSVNDSNEA